MINKLKVGIAGFGVVGKKRKKILDSIKGVKIISKLYVPDKMYCQISNLI